MNQSKRWVEIRERGTHRLASIVYNPYERSTKWVLAFWLGENAKFFYGVRTA